jgi:hypothetical protein
MYQKSMLVAEFPSTYPGSVRGGQGPMHTNTLAEVLRDQIRASGRSISSIAVESRTVQPIVHRFATGPGDITLRTASKIADLLGLGFVPKSQGQLFEAILVKTIAMFDELDRELRKDGVTLQAARVRRYRNTVLLPELSQLRQQLGAEGGGQAGAGPGGHPAGGPGRRGRGPQGCRGCRGRRRCRGRQGRRGPEGARPQGRQTRQ